MVNGASRRLLLGIGANVAGNWGLPRRSLARALKELEKAGVEICRVSKFYITKPVGNLPQPRFLNAVVLAQAHVAPSALLRLVKGIERESGRIRTRPMGRRALDIDILDYGGRRIGPQGSRRMQGRLLLPHPEIHKRAFVLVPLMEVAPSWRHPVSGVQGRTLLARLAPVSRAGVRPSP